MQRRIFHLLLITCLLPRTSLRAQDSTVLTFEAYMQVVKTYHPVAKQAELIPQLAAARLLKARAGFDPELAMSWKQKTFDGTRYYDYVQPNVTIPLWYGMDITAGIESINGEKVNPESSLGEVSYAGVKLPLAKGLFMDERRAALKTARIFVDLSQLEQQKTMNDLYRDAGLAYWDWALAQSQLEVWDTAMVVTRRRMDMLQITYRQGNRSAMDTLELSTQIQALELNRNEAWVTLQNAKLALQVYLWTATVEPYSLPGFVQPERAWELSNPQIDSLPPLQELIDQTLASHPELRSFPYKMQTLQIERQLKFQYLLPKIDLKYQQLGKGYNLLAAQSGPLFENNYRFGLDFAIPLRLSQGRGAYREAKLKIRQTELEQDLKTRQTLAKLMAAYNKVLTAVQQSTLASSNFQQYERLLRSEELLFRNGESSLFLINSRQTKSLDARIKMLKFLAGFQQYFIELQWATGLGALNADQTDLPD